MGCVDQPSLDRPRVIDADAQLAALHALRIAVSGAKRSALESDEQLPRVRLDVGKPLPDFATEKEVHIRGAVTKLDEEERRR